MALNLDLVLFLVFHGSLPYLNEAKKTIGEIIGNSTMGPASRTSSLHVPLDKCRVPLDKARRLTRQWLGPSNSKLSHATSFCRHVCYALLGSRRKQRRRCVTISRTPCRTSRRPRIQNMSLSIRL